MHLGATRRHAARDGRSFLPAAPLPVVPAGGASAAGQPDGLAIVAHPRGVSPQSLDPASMPAQAVSSTGPFLPMETA